jgi:PAS domain-containing protein
MSIRVKILLGFAVILGLGAVMGLAQIRSSQVLTKIYNELNVLQNTSAEIAGVLNAHYIWRHGLVEAVLTNSEFKGSLDPQTCALGKWLQGDDAKKLSDREVLSLLRDVSSPHTYIHTEAKVIVELMSAGRADEAKQSVIGNILPKTQEVISLLTRIENRYVALTNEKTAESEATGDYFNRRIRVLNIFVLVFCVLFALLLSYWISEKIYWHENILDSIPFPLSITDIHRRWTFVNKPVEIFLGKKRSAILGQPCSNWGATICDTENCGINCLERGKTLTGFSHKGMDFKVSLSYLTNKRGRRIGHIETVEETTEFMNRQRAELDMANKINDSITDLSASISEVSKKTSENAKLSERAASLAGMMKQNAEKGSTQMDELMSSVKEINQASHNISNVIKAIDDIAAQTNLLALNASVEAARVGEMGKGFAVVADEVRNLAGRSAEAARNTNSLIKDSIDKAELGVRVADETASSLNNIVSGINDSNQIATEIAKASEEQSVAIQQINKAIAQVSLLVDSSKKIAETVEV